MQPEKNNLIQHETADRRSLLGLGFETQAKVQLLVVDDSPESNRLFSLATRNLPAHLLQATNPLQALDVLSENSIDLLVLDWDLGDITGADFLNMYLKNRRAFKNADKPFYLITYSASDKEEITLPKAFQSNYLGHFKKTLPFKKLRENFFRIYNTLIIKEATNA